MTRPGEPLLLGAVVLTGGSGTRLGGVDKAALDLDGVTLLERVLAATEAAHEVVVVGPPTVTSRPVTWAQEDPPGGGPAAGLLTGLDRFRRPPDLVTVLAVDMPRVGAATVARLTWAVEADPHLDGAVLVDATGRRQTLAGVYRHRALRDAQPADPAARHGLPVHRLVGSLRLAEVPTIGDEAHDVDTPADLARLRGRQHPPR